MKGFTKTSFIDDCLNGYATIDDLDYYVDFWHNHQTGNPLPVYLGLSDTEYGAWVLTEDREFFTELIKMKTADHSNVKTKCINGNLRVGDIVLSTPDDEYSCLVGRVADIKLFGAPDRDTENSSDDVYVDFSEFEYPDKRKKELEKLFSDLYGEPKKFDELPLDVSIMNPDGLIRITDIDKEFLKSLLGSGQNAAEYCYVVLRRNSIIASQLRLESKDIILVPNLYFEGENVTAHIDERSGIVEKLGLSLKESDWIKIYLTQNLKNNNFSISYIHGRNGTVDDEISIFRDFSDNEKQILACLMDEVSFTKFDMNLVQAWLTLS